ncbi:BZIP domain-containing protein [Meloidogyne graminicola]|uniref:BZIP domain-containing protein n=1 Tax=Meloidogyne graminicola TaxID=189291 RepID=A0A8S9ZCS1_9BILA|nr:BZIP domain-containing protein [Meloidogyne graminicola]
MQSRIEMICEDVNVLNSIAPEPKLTRTMIICEDVNRNDNNADNPGLLTQQDAPPDGTINVMNNQEQNSLFCAPASPERSPSVMEQKPNVWRQQLVQPQRGLGGGSRAEWDSSNRPVRLPRLVRRGVGGLKCGQTGGSTATNFSGRPKCLFKCAASKPKSSIYPDMPCLTCYEMRGYYGSGGGGQYFGGGGESEFDERAAAAKAFASTRMCRRIHQSLVHCCSSKNKHRKYSKLSSKSTKLSSIECCKQCHYFNKYLGLCLKWQLLQLQLLQQF